MLEIITKKISSKIIVALFILMSLSSITVVYFTTTKVSEDSIEKTKENLEMLNAAMFQSLRNAMNTGDPVQIAKAEEDARKIFIQIIEAISYCHTHRISHRDLKP